MAQRVVEWSKRWQLNLSEPKCQVLHITNRRQVANFNYSINNSDLENTKMVKDLGFYVSKNLKFSDHCQRISAKALRIAALIFRVFRTRKSAILLRAYKAYVRPIVESGSSVWNPHLCKDIDIIEKVQRYFTRRLFYRCRLPMLSYTERLNFLELETLEKRRVKTDLILCYKIKNGLVDLDFNKFFQIRERQSRGHSSILHVKSSRINARKNFFANRVVNQWNKLSEDQITARSVGIFKHKLSVSERGLRFV